MKEIVLNLIIGIVSGLIVNCIIEYIKNRKGKEFQNQKSIAKKTIKILFVSILIPFLSMLYTTQEEILYLLNTPFSIKITMSILMMFYTIILLREK